jgi:hypothetical protein
VSAPPSIASNLMGRVAKGHWRSDNPKHVYPDDREKKKVYGPECDKRYLWHELSGEIVAVTTDSDWGGDKYLVLWVVDADGTPRELDKSAKIMPRGFAGDYREA